MPQIASPSGGLPSAVRWAQLLLKDRLQGGDIAIDATAGNGHDTLFLALTVGPSGHVHAFDVQEAAIQHTRQRLIDAGIDPSVYTLFHAGHETMKTHVPAGAHGSVQAIMFNLGYLPGSDKAVITQTSKTLAALAQGLEILAAGGLMTVVVYPGHDGGAEEALAIEELASALDSRAFEIQHLRPVNPGASPPSCWAFWKRDR